MLKDSLFFFGFQVMGLRFFRIRVGFRVKAVKAKLEHNGPIGCDMSVPGGPVWDQGTADEGCRECLGLRSSRFLTEPVQVSRAQKKL